MELFTISQRKVRHRIGYIQRRCSARSDPLSPLCTWEGQLMSKIEWRALEFAHRTFHFRSMALCLGMVESCYQLAIHSLKVAMMEITSVTMAWLFKSKCSVGDWRAQMICKIGLLLTQDITTCIQIKLCHLWAEMDPPQHGALIRQFLSG